MLSWLVIGCEFRMFLFHVMLQIVELLIAAWACACGDAVFKFCGLGFLGSAAKFGFSEFRGRLIVSLSLLLYLALFNVELFF